ncbi:hypothetical protein U0070_021509 [Myodes glareolus]|uniref:GAB2 n=1 Tax=Myodes glareolus TaxID=447135 RepID=A0AAW0JD23_MYOGA
MRGRERSLPAQAYGSEDGRKLVNPKSPCCEKGYGSFVTLLKERYDSSLTIVFIMTLLCRWEGPEGAAFRASSRLHSAGDMGGGDNMVCTGWLRKSPPEKKLRYYAWKKNAGLTFNTKELQGGFVFDIKTSECTFYLVAETEANVSKWVHSTYQICGFLSTDSLRNLFSASHSSRSSVAEFSSPSQHLLRDRKSSAPSHIQPALFTSVPPRSISACTNASAEDRKCEECWLLSERSAEDLASHSHTKGSLTGSETDNEDVDIFMTSSNTLLLGVWRPPGGQYGCSNHSSLTLPCHDSDHVDIFMTSSNTLLLGVWRLPSGQYGCSNHSSLTLPCHDSDHSWRLSHSSPGDLCPPPNQVSQKHLLRSSHPPPPPPVNHNLKPDQRAQPTPIDLRHNVAINDLPFKSFWYCCPISTQSITSTDLGASTPGSHWHQQPSSKKDHWQWRLPSPGPSAGSLSPHHKPFTSSVTSDGKADSVQVDKEKTQALQNTMQEWTDVLQSSDPSKL